MCAFHVPPPKVGLPPISSSSERYALTQSHIDSGAYHTVHLCAPLTHPRPCCPSSRMNPIATSAKPAARTLCFSMLSVGDMVAARFLCT